MIFYFFRFNYMKPDYTPFFIFLLCVIPCLLNGCTQVDTMRNSPVKSAQKHYGLVSDNASPVSHQGLEKELYAASTDCSKAATYLEPMNYRVDKPLAVPSADQAPAPTVDLLYSRDIPLSPGDLLEVTIESGEGFSGRYEVASNGFLNMPQIAPIFAQGIGVHALSEKIELALVRDGIFRAGTLAINLQILQLSEIEVSVSGAVFEAGRVRINDKIPAQVQEIRTAAFGDYAATRMLSEALRAASGVRPDAKLDQVVLIRSGWQVEVDVTGILTGQAVRDIALVAGDQIIVPTSGCFQPHLVRPSQITPKGFRVFMSNLIEPSLSNANSAVGSFASSLPYGSRLLQGAVSANCIGGKQMTNASRSVILASKNPLTGEVQVLQRSVEALMRNPQATDMNPYLMPNDAIACYDSATSNIRDIARVVSEIVAPYRMLIPY
jgi:polysaccharide biosynthesis/export protein